jgi:hypothetical protein
VSNVSAAKLKVTMVLQPIELLGVAAPEGKDRLVLRVTLPGRVLSADIAGKSLRKVQTAIRERGAENVVLVLQGNLVANDSWGHRLRRG